MKYQAIGVCLAVSLVSACGGGAGSSTTAPPPSYPSVAGNWTGMLIGASPDASAAVRLTIEQTSDIILGSLQRIHGLWTGTIGSQQVGGNFNGGLATDGRMQFTLVLSGGGSCNFSMDVRAQGNRTEGTFGTVGPVGCAPTSVSPAGRVELTRE